MTKKKLYRGILTLLAVGAVCTAAAAPQQGNEPTNLTADSLTYDTTTGLVTAEKNVRLEQGTGWIEGARATYNTKTEEGTVEGGVRAMREDMNLSCDRLFAASQEHWQATGSVHMVKAERTFTGPQVDYYPSQNDYILAGSGGTITSADGTLTADRLEGWMKENRFVGTGNAHIVSPPRDLEGGGDRMEYFGGVERPYVVLDGSAWVFQGNNMARSNHMTVYLADDGSAVAK
ncbi:MAG: LptA/OstA family protein [Centipeda sp. (in: firmicutes)]